MIIKLIALVALIKLSIAEDRPLLCACLYTFVTFMAGLFVVLTGGAAITALLLATLIRFAVSFVYFWLLSRAGDGILWWVVMGVGAPVVFYI